MNVLLKSVYLSICLSIRLSVCLYLFKEASSYRVIRMKNVRSRRVVDDDDVVKLSAQPAQVFDVVAAVKDARLAKQATVENVPFVQEVGNWVRILKNE